MMTSKVEEEEDTFWGFGYGSNMNVDHITEKKRVQILEHVPAVLKDFKLVFMRGSDLVEPGFGGVIREEGAETHGLAYRLTKANMEKMDKNEGGGRFYAKVKVSLEAYDGRTLNGEIHMNRIPPKDPAIPSRRYLNLLINGAKSVGLQEKYIQWLESIPTYKTPDNILEARKKHIPPNFDGLKEITWDELNKHKVVGDIWLSVMGYVIKFPNNRVLFSSFWGTESAGRSILHFNDISIDENPTLSRGKPPYPLLKDMRDDELEYLKMTLDQRMFSVDVDYNITGVSEIVGYLKEWKEQQDKGTTEFKKPEKNL